MEEHRALTDIILDFGLLIYIFQLRMSATVPPSFIFLCLVFTWYIHLKV